MHPLHDLGLVRSTDLDSCECYGCSFLQDQSTASYRITHVDMVLYKHQLNCGYGHLHTANRMNDVDCSRWSNPFPSVYPSINPYRRLAGVRLFTDLRVRKPQPL